MIDINIAEDDPFLELKIQLNNLAFIRPGARFDLAEESVNGEKLQSNIDSCKKLYKTLKQFVQINGSILDEAAVAGSETDSHTLAGHTKSFLGQFNKVDDLLEKELTVENLDDCNIALRAAIRLIIFAFTKAIEILEKATRSKTAATEEV